MPRLPYAHPLLHVASMPENSVMPHYVNLHGGKTHLLLHEGVKVVLAGLVPQEAPRPRHLQIITHGAARARGLLGPVVGGRAMRVLLLSVCNALSCDGVPLDRPVAEVSPDSCLTLPHLWCGADQKGTRPPASGW